MFIFLSQATLTADITINDIKLYTALKKMYECSFRIKSWKRASNLFSQFLNKYSLMMI